MPWEATTGKFGDCNYTYNVYRQVLYNECTATTLIMIAKYALDIDINILTARYLIRRAQAVHDEDFDAFFNDQPVRRFSRMTPDSTFDWANRERGGSAQDIFFALKRLLPEHPWEWVLPTADSEMPKRLRDCTADHPAVVSISWDHDRSRDGVGHVALCLGRKKGEYAMVYLDSTYGVVTGLYKPKGNELVYDTTDCSFGGGGVTGRIEEAILG